MLKEILTELEESQEMIRFLEARTFDLIQKLASLKPILNVLNDDMVKAINELIRDVREINNTLDDLADNNLDIMLIVAKKIKDGGE